MCILCVIQKWSRRVATMLPWLVIPLIGLWALSQLLPPAFRFEITSPRLACVLVLLVTLFWYEILMPQLSAWRVRRNNRLKERKRFEAIEMQKLRKTATRKCRNCLTPYRDQNPGGGKFMCSYCGHISKRPVLDLPVPPGLGLSNTGILKDLVGKSGKILNGKVWSDNGWMCGQDWLDNGNWVAGSLTGKPSYWSTNGGGLFIGEDCLSEKSYSRVLTLICKALTAFFLSITWLWEKIFGVSSSRDDASSDAERRGLLDKRGENGGNFPESRGEKARRKAEEKRQARLEKELLEEEERKQREEVARLVEERRRRLRDEKIEAEKEHGKLSPSTKERDNKKEAEKKRQERKKDRDRGSSKSNSDAEELDKRSAKESDRNKRNENDRREQLKNGTESLKPHSTEGHGFKVASISTHNRGNAGTRYLDRMRGTFLSSSRALTGGGFFGKSTNTNTVLREHRSNTSPDPVLTYASRKDLASQDRTSGKLNVHADDKNISHPVFMEPQTSAAPKKSWQQLFTRSSVTSASSNSNVISRPNGKSQAEAQNPAFSGQPTPMKTYDNPISFGLPSPFTSSSLSFGPKSNSTTLPLSSESIFPRIGKVPQQPLPDELEVFEDPCYDAEAVSLLGPVSESLDNFQLDLGFVDTGSNLENSCAPKNITTSCEVSRPSPIESPMSRLRVPEERHSSSFLFPTTPKGQGTSTFPLEGLNTASDAGTWQMWNSSPLGQDGFGLIGSPASWLMHPQKEDIIQPAPQKTMASLFKKDDQLLSSSHSEAALFGNCHSGGTFSTPMSASTDILFPQTVFGTYSGGLNQLTIKPKEEVAKNEVVYGSPSSSTANNSFESSPPNSWAKKDWTVQSSGECVGNPSLTRPHVGGLYTTPSVQSLWSYD